MPPTTSVVGGTGAWSRMGGKKVRRPRLVPWAARVSVCRSPLGEWHDAAPAERYSATADELRPGGHNTPAMEGTQGSATLFRGGRHSVAAVGGLRRGWVKDRDTGRLGRLRHWLASLPEHADMRGHGLDHESLSLRARGPGRDDPRQVR